MAFRLAADTELIDVVKYLVENGAQVNAKDSVRIGMYHIWHIIYVQTSCCHSTVFFSKQCVLANDNTIAYVLDPHSFLVVYYCGSTT